MSPLDHWEVSESVGPSSASLGIFGDLFYFLHSDNIVVENKIKVEEMKKMWREDGKKGQRNRKKKIWREYKKEVERWSIR